MDRLASWFDGGDFIALAVGLVSIAVSVIVSVVMTRRQDRIALANADLQRRMTEIEEARRREEISLMNAADVRVTCEWRIDASRLHGDEYRMVVENRGSDSARDVSLDEVTSRPPGQELPGILGHIFPIPELKSNGRVSCGLAFGMDTVSSFDVTVSWEDNRGRQTSTQLVTLNPQ